MYHRGQYRDALTHLSSRPSLTKDAANYAAYYTAQAELKLGRTESARRQFAALANRRQTGYLSQAATLGEAEAAEAAGRHSAARRIYERLLTGPLMGPDYVWLRLAKAHVAAGEPALAIEAFRRLRDQFPLSQFTAEATRELSRLGALEPVAAGTARYRQALARADLLFGAKRYREARVLYGEIEKHARDVERDRVQVRRALCDYFDRQFATARRLLRPHLNRGAHQPESRFYDLMAAAALNANAEFEQLARDFVDRFSATIWAEDVLDALGTQYIRLDRVDQADAAFRQILNRFPTGRFAERAAWKVGWRAYRFGSLVEAVRVFERAAAAFPRSDYRPAYLYWAARARESLGESESAALRYALVHTDYLHSYYGRLASVTLDGNDRALPTSFVAAKVTRPDRSTVDDAGVGLPPTSDVIRLLLAAELYDDALNEIRYAQQVWGDTPALQATLGWLHHGRGELLAASNLVKRAYPQYLTASGADVPSELRAVIFPVGYWNLIRQHASEHRLDPHLLAALIAQESAFVPDIRSPAKATGLMQLMPATAERYARKLGLTSSTTMLTRPNLNLGLGTAYFADLLREFGEVHLALASYNAGESRVRRWIAERPNLPPDEFIDDIPFPETQNYVKRILGAADNYRRLYRVDSDLPFDLDRAIPSLASRRSDRQQPPSPAPQAAAPGRPGTAAKPVIQNTKPKPGHRFRRD